MQRFDNGPPESMDFEASARDMMPEGNLDASTAKLRHSEETLRVGMPTISTQQPLMEKLQTFPQLWNLRTLSSHQRGTASTYLRPRKRQALAQREGRTGREQQLSTAMDGTLSRSMELASIVMQNSRLEMNSLKSLTLASLSANDNYDHGVRKVKPKNPTEVRALPTETIKAIKKSRSNVAEYISSNAVMHDKYYLEAVKPGLRDKNSLDESVRQFMLELQKSPVRVLGLDAEGFVSPEKKRHRGGKKEEKESRTD